MKKILFIAAIFISGLLQAQVKVHNDGQISLQIVSNNWYNGVQIYPNGVTYFNTTQINPGAEFSIIIHNCPENNVQHLTNQ